MRPIRASGQSVAIPFVGTTAASFVLAETVRLFHEGPAYPDLKLRLATPGELQATSCGMHTTQNVNSGMLSDFAASRDHKGDS